MLFSLHHALTPHFLPVQSTQSKESDEQKLSNTEISGHNRSKAPRQA